MLYFSAPLNSEMHSWRRFDKLFVIRCVEWAFHLLWLLIQLQPLLAVALVVTTTEGFVPTIKEVRWIINPVVTWCILTSTVMKSILCLVGIGLRKNPIWRSWGPKNLILKIVLLKSLNCNKVYFRHTFSATAAGECMTIYSDKKFLRVRTISI